MTLAPAFDCIFAEMFFASKPSYGHEASPRREPVSANMEQQFAAAPRAFGTRPISAGLTERAVAG
jgi:hypothetical protein